MPPPSSKFAKLQGEWAEVCFLARAVRMGLTVSSPYGESATYDFIVDSGARLHRVQVKSVSLPDGGSYRISSTRGSRTKRRYTATEVDFLAAYVIPHDAWYIIPVCAFTAVKTVRLCPHRPSHRRFEPFREAWSLLTDKGCGAQSLP